jgi:hypothetical protein
MQRFDLSTSIGRLREVAEVLERHWAETKEYWKDANAESFQEEHIQPLFLEINTAMSVMQRMSDLTRQAQRECLPERQNEFL